MVVLPGRYLEKAVFERQPFLFNSTRFGVVVLLQRANPQLNWG